MYFSFYNLSNETVETLYSTQKLYLIQFSSTFIYFTWLHSTLLCPTLPYSPLQVNHVWQSLPIAVNGPYGEMKLYKKKQYTVMETTFGLQMLLDDHHRLFLQLDERYKGEMCGLCGTYSDDQGDDFLTPNGTKPETNVVTFANSWRVNSSEDDR